jgi:predicted DsbA family dithiol-disulfide isomerase
LVRQQANLLYVVRLATLLIALDASATQDGSTSMSTAVALHSFPEEEGRGRAYRDAAHRAFFVEGLNLANEGVLREAAQEAGLNADEAIVAAWDPERISGLRAVREEAKNIGVHGVPTIATAERVLYYGAALPGRSARC